MQMKSVVYSHVQLMHPKLENKYLKLEQSRNRLLDELKVLDHAQLNTAPAPGKWSINQHLAHLVLVEEQVLQVLRHQLQEPEQLQDAPFTSGIKALLVKAALASGKKYKAPAQVATVPEVSLLHELRQRWDTCRFALEDMLTDFPPRLLDKAVFKHPVAGPFTLIQTLAFVQDHLAHHEQQLQTLKRQLTT